MLDNLSGFSVISECTNGDDAIALYKSVQPDVVILDLNTPGTEGIRTIKQLKKLDPEAKILILTVIEDKVPLDSYVDAGALAVVNKNSSQEIFVKALKRVGLGKSYYSSSTFETDTINNFEKIFEITLDPSRMLTPREFTVFKMLARNMNDLEIAEQRGLDEATVAIYKHNIFKKLNLKNQEELVTIHGKGYG